MGAGLSDIGAEGAAFFAASRGGALRLVADAGAELVGGDASAAPACDCGCALGAGGGSAVMMLTGGIDCDEGNCTFGPGGVIGVLEVTGLLGVVEAIGRVRVGQFAA